MNEIERAIEQLKDLRKDRVRYLICNTLSGEEVILENDIKAIDASMAALSTLLRIQRDLNEPDKIYIHISDYFGRYGKEEKEAANGRAN